jgi:hypothetical protein
MWPSSFSTTMIIIYYVCRVMFIVHFYIPVPNCTNMSCYYFVSHDGFVQWAYANKEKFVSDGFMFVCDKFCVDGVSIRPKLCTHSNSVHND